MVYSTGPSDASGGMRQLRDGRPQPPRPARGQHVRRRGREPVRRQRDGHAVDVGARRRHRVVVDIAAAAGRGASATSGRDPARRVGQRVRPRLRPPEDADLGVTVDGATAPHTDDGTALVRVGVQGREVSDDERPPVALTFVVDTSGSMDIHNRLGSGSVVVGPAGQLPAPGRHRRHRHLQHRRPGRAASDTGRESDTIVAAIDELTPHGSTNMAGGLREGYAIAAEAYLEGGLNTVVLASDGVANVGTTARSHSPRRSRSAPTRGSTWPPSATAWATTTTT